MCYYRGFDAGGDSGGGGGAWESLAVICLGYPLWVFEGRGMDG